jgi:hypothetical protein
MLGKKDGIVDGIIDETTLGSNDEFDVGYALGWSEVGIIDGAPLGSSVGKTVGPRVVKVLGTTDG